MLKNKNENYLGFRSGKDEMRSIIKKISME